MEWRRADIPTDTPAMEHFWNGALDWLAVTLFLIGAVAFTLGRKGWRSDKLLCARCHYSLAQTTTEAIPKDTRCPECGNTVGVPGGSRDSRPSPLLKSIGLLTSTLGLALWLWNGAFEGFERAFLPRYRVTETHVWSETHVTISRPRWSDDIGLPLVEVRQAGRIVYASTMSYPSVGTARILDPHTKGEVPLFWIRSDSGGSLGLSETYVFYATDSDERLPEFLPYAVLSEGGFVKSDPSMAEPDLWVWYDLTYAYWLTSGANSPSVSLKGIPTPWGIVWNDPSPTDAPDSTQLAKIRTQVRELASAAKPDGPIDFRTDKALGLVLDAFLELVYAGRASEAWPFLRASYADGLGALAAASEHFEVPRTREALEQALIEAMQGSRFIDEILRRNHGSIAASAPSSLERSDE